MVIDEQLLYKIWNHVEKETSETNHLNLSNIMICGKTGVGKSSLINAIHREEVCKTGIVPTTFDFNFNKISKEIFNINFIDVPGFGELKNLNHTHNIDIINITNKIEAYQPSIILLVVKCDDNALNLEIKFLEHITQNYKINRIPIIIAINQIDKAKPLKFWDPQKVNLINPNKPKEINIVKYIQYLKSIKSFKNININNFFPICSGELYNDNNIYGINDLILCFYNNVSDEYKLCYSKVFKLHAYESNRIINKLLSMNSVYNDSKTILMLYFVRLVKYLSIVYNLNVSNLNQIIKFINFINLNEIIKSFFELMPSKLNHNKIEQFLLLKIFIGNVIVDLFSANVKVINESYIASKLKKIYQIKIA